MRFVYSNNCETTVGSLLAANQSELVPFDLDVFPNWDANRDEFTPLFLIIPPVLDAAGNVTTSEQFEIVHAYARSGSFISVERGQEGTTPLEFPAGSLIEARLTKAAWDSINVRNDNDLHIVHGLNFGVDSGSPSKLETTIEGLNGLSENTEINIMANHQNDSTLFGGVVTLTLTGISTSDVRMIDGSELRTGAIKPRKVCSLRYTPGTPNYWTLQNPDPTPAGEGEAGLATKATDAQATDGTNDETFVTPKQVKDALDANNQFQYRYAPKWRYLGEGNGDVTINAPSTYEAGRAYDFRTLTINQDGEMNITGTGVAVIRCTGTLTIRGSVTAARARVPEGPFPVQYPYLGGRGGANVLYPGHPPALGDAGNGQTPDSEARQLSYEEGVPFSWYQGGTGQPAIQNDGDRVPAAPAAGGVIFIAEKIILHGSAEFYAEGRNNLPAGTASSSGASGGGCFVFAYTDSIEGHTLPDFFLAEPLDKASQQIDASTVHVAGGGWVDFIKTA